MTQQMLIHNEEDAMQRLIESAEQFGHALPFGYEETLFHTLVSVLNHAHKNNPTMTIEQLFDRDACVRMLVKAQREQVLQ